MSVNSYILAQKYNADIPFIPAPEPTASYLNTLLESAWYTDWKAVTVEVAAVLPPPWSVIPSHTTCEIIVKRRKIRKTSNVCCIIVRVISTN
jgi:hypothetical protein